MKRTTALLASGALAATALGGVAPIMADPPPAAALSENLGFSAADEPTWQTDGTVWALAASGGTIFAGGTFGTISPPEGQSGSPRAVTSFASFDAATGQPQADPVAVGGDRPLLGDQRRPGRRVGGHDRRGAGQGR